MKFDRHLPKLAYSIKEACQASSLGKTTIYAHIYSRTSESRSYRG